jgi:Type II secretion system (T2SS), protein K
MQRVNPVHSRRRASVIVVVLITLMLASLMIVQFIDTSAVELVLATRAADRTHLKADAYAALETALAVMSEIKQVDNGKIYAPAQGWDDPYGYSGESPRDGLEVKFEFKDESGRISLPTLKFDDMILLAEALGLEEHDAKRFSDGLYTWMKADHVPQDIEAEASRYERGALPHKAPLRSLRSWDELRAVSVANTYVYDEDGALTPFGAALRENLSLYRYNGANINAVVPAWFTLHKWDEFQQATVTNYMSGSAPRPAGAPKWFRSTNEVGKVIGAKIDLSGLSTEVRLLRIYITLKEGAANMRLNALVALDDNVALPATTPADGPAAAAPDAAANGTAAPAARTPAATKPATGGANATSSASGADPKLNYPVRILEISFDSGPPVLAEEPETTAPTS